MSEKTVPILPCRTLQPVVDFYAALGFEVTYQQKSPNPYAVVVRGDIELQFFGTKHHDPHGAYSTCYVRTDDVDGLYRTFRAGLGAAYGKVPTRGLPRIGPLKDLAYGVRQFLMTDPGGNCVRVGQALDTTARDTAEEAPGPEGTFARALRHASLLADSKEDLTGAAKVIDRALGLTDERPTPPQLLRLLVLRADVAARIGDEAAAASACAEAAAVRLSAAERASVRDDLRRLAELRLE